ncbi:YolD-like family protein [Lentibacillus saliphilus]|uniref:YolD-like family protein n=1 Tax=Lentibacillus saliphilus TaxID=2737028 RepID=UPI001C30464A|nr:YolD-like family protein [Lentibacillus saliphilus]
MLKDRGTIKWTSLMLPEHVKMLKELWDEQQIEPRPILDAQELDRFNNQLIQAYETQTSLKIAVYMVNRVSWQTGFITKLDPTSKSIELQTNTHKRSISIYDVVDIQTDD